MSTNQNKYPGIVMIFLFYGDGLVAVELLLFLPLCVAVVVILA